MVNKRSRVAGAPKQSVISNENGGRLCAVTGARVTRRRQWETTLRGSALVKIPGTLCHVDVMYGARRTTRSAVRGIYAPPGSLPNRSVRRGEGYADTLTNVTATCVFYGRRTRVDDNLLDRSHRLQSDRGDCYPKTTGFIRPLGGLSSYSLRNTRVFRRF